MTSRRPRSPKTSELIAQELAKQIIDSDLPEGTLLPTEKEMVDQYAVGRTTLREALRILETRGVLTIRSGPRGGPVVRRPKPGDLREALTLILQFEQTSLSAILEAREALEPVLARLASDRINSKQLDALHSSVEIMRDQANSHEEFLIQNKRFHHGIAEASGSVVLRVFSETLENISDGAAVGIEYPIERREAVASAHGRIHFALAEGDNEAAEKEMMVHLREAGAFWEKSYPHLWNQPVKWLQL